MSGPKITVYHAVKRLVTGMAQGLHGEGRRLSVAVHAVCPGPISGTRFYNRDAMKSKGPNESLFTGVDGGIQATSPDTVARVAFNIIGSRSATAPVGLFGYFGFVAHAVCGPNVLSVFFSMLYPFMHRASDKHALKNQ
ncbi:hypothetical protein KIPB_012492 [Kipferlia bialata]|uniref:Uncharacterized protein n=1 Tax=Kipferlia bialata TaxID=797122 RepID=A0A9K3D7X1_9EUKA|nr:hypothetical protein KIPB_012492 [Kipferlia bialata]|eukprot:g12492.t1